MAAVAQPSEFARIERAYRLLGVTPDTSALRIKRAYRQLARVWHPDKFAQSTTDQRRATERMREINEAYQLAKHAPLRYRSDLRSAVAQSRVASAVRHAAPATDTVEYIVRFVSGFAFGLFVSVLLLLADTPVAVLAVTPLLTGGGSAVFGDRFWYWVLKHWWMWSP